MTRIPATYTALMSAHPLPAGEGAPEWVHLLPMAADGLIRTSDQRGPYRAIAAEALIQASFAEVDRLPIDENHAIDLAAPKGLPAPARGWIVEMQARADGIWGRVEWTDEGRDLVASRAYRGLSPVVVHDGSKEIAGILRASLVNRPNLRGLTALHQESDMNLIQRLAELLGLDAASSDQQVYDAVAALKTGKSETATTALQSQLGEIGVILGAPAGSDAAAVLAAAKAAVGTGPDNKIVVSLQAELTDVTRRLQDLQDSAARTKAETFVDGEIRRGRGGVKSLRDHYVSAQPRPPRITRST